GSFSDDCGTRGKNLVMNYFDGLTNESEIKTRYKELAKRHHPDLGGYLEIMKVINCQYEKILTGAYQIVGKSITEIDELLVKDEMYRQKIFSVSSLSGVTVELCGSWIWISGDTKTHKEIFKTSGFKWSPKKCMWYYRPEGQKCFSRKS